MKKLKIFMLVLGCAIFSCISFGCDTNENNIQASFKQESLEIVLGQTYNPFDYLDFEEENRDKIVFKSGDTDCVYVTPAGKVVATGEGGTYVYAFAGEKQLGQMFVSVASDFVQFSSPINLSFDNVEKTLSWNAVYAESISGVVLAPSYTIEITKDSLAPQTFQSQATTFSITDKGEYKVRVKANGGGIYLGSDYLKSPTGEYVYFTFSLVDAPINLAYEKDSQILTWIDENNLDGMTYNVYVNNQKVQSGLTVCNAVVPTSNGGLFKIKVEAVPQGEKYSSFSQELTVTQLVPLILSFDNGLLSWSKLMGATGYELILDNGQPIILDANTLSYDFSDIASGEHTVQAKAIGSEEDYVLEASQSTKIFTKLDAPRVVFDSFSNQFFIENVDSHNSIMQLYANNQIVEEQNNYLEFTETTNDIFSISAQLFTKNPSSEIDSETSTSFVLSGAENNGNLKYVKNLEKPKLEYYVKNSTAYVTFIENDEYSCYAWKLNGNARNLSLVADSTPNRKVFSLGLVDSVFTSLDTYTIQLDKTKQMQEETYFFSTNNKINIQKLTAPQKITLSDKSSSVRSYEVETESINTDVLDSVRVKINNIETASREIDTSQNSMFTISAQFVPISDFRVVGGIETYYVASNYSNFIYSRLSSPANLDYQYSNRLLTWDKVTNAQSYDIFEGEDIDALSKTTNSVTLSNTSATSVKVIAVAEKASEILVGEYKYFNSLPAELTLYRAANLEKLDLTLNSDKSITASWERPDGVPNEKSVLYKVYLNSDQQTSAAQSQTTFDFDAALFQDAGSYIVNVEVVSPDNDFYLPVNNAIRKTITKLSKPTVMGLTELGSGEYYITSPNFNSEIMSGIIVDGQEQANKIEFTLNDGEEFSTTLAYKGIFDNDNNIYYLDSDISEPFSVKRLVAPINIYYQNSVITWEVLNADEEEFANFAYVLESNSQSQSTSTINEKSLQVNLSTAMIFKVCETPKSTSKSIQANGKLYTASTYATFAIYKESEVTNLKMELNTEGDVVVYWNYDKISALENDSNYMPNFNLQIFANSTEILSEQMSVESVYSSERNRFEKTFEIEFFADATEYQVKINTISEVSVPSNKVGINITKLGAVENATLHTISTSLSSLNVKHEVRLKQENAIDLVSLIGAIGIEITGDLSLSLTNSVFQIPEYSDLGPKTVNFIVKAISPENIQDGNYYLDSETTSFVLQKLTAPTITFDSQTNKLSWTAQDNAAAYYIELTNAINMSQYLFDITATEIDLNQFADFLADAGEIRAIIKSVPLSEQNRVKNSQDRVFLASDEQDVFAVQKLARVSNISLNALLDDTSDDNDKNIKQIETVLTFSAVNYATEYNIYINGTLFETYRPIDLTQSEFSLMLTNQFEQAKLYQIQIEAIANSYLSSGLTNSLDITRLNEFVNAGSVILDSANTFIDLSAVLNITCPEQTRDINGYFIQIYDNHDNLLDSVRLANTDDKYVEIPNLSWFTSGSANGQDFEIRIFILGNGRGSLNGTDVTLSSKQTKIVAHKLATPEMEIENENLIISSADDAVYGEKFKYHYQIFIDSVLKTQGIYDGPVLIPNTWAEGHYEIKVQAVVNANVKNLVNSEVKSFEPTKLARVTNVGVLASVDSGLEQKYNEYTFSSVENATNYDIYVNGVFVYNMQTTQTGTITTDAKFRHILLENEEYKVMVVAKANGYISSINSVEAVAYRLNPIQEFIVSATDLDWVVNWERISQAANHYTYALTLCDSNNELKDQVSNVTEQIYDGFKDNQWLKSYVGGEFKLQIRVVGNGSPDANTKVTTLSSSIYEITVLKAFAPNILPSPAYLTVENNILVSTTPSGNLVSESTTPYYSIQYGTDFALDKNNQEIKNVAAGEQFVYPNSWESGQYTITAITKVNQNVFNVIPSNFRAKTVERLVAPSELKFYRGTTVNTDEYSSDITGFDIANYLSPSLFFEFKTSEHAEEFVFNNNGMQQILPNYNAATQSAELVGDFADLVKGYGGSQTITAFAVAPEGGVYINSPITSLSYFVLNSISSFRAVNGNVMWNSISNALYYLVKASDIEDTERFWQNPATTTSSNLNGIIGELEAGAIAFNIKALGNVGPKTEGQTSTNLLSGQTITLDSEYMSIDTEFIKLETPKDLTVNYGFVSFNEVAEADYYQVIVSDENDNVIFERVAVNMVNKFYTYKYDYAINLSDYSIEENTLYKVKIQAMKNSGEGNYINSDYTQELQVRLLENVNSVGDIKIVRPTQLLTDNSIQAKIATNAKGVLAEMNQEFMNPVLRNTADDKMRLYINFGNLSDTGYFTLKIASLGSSSAESDGTYFLTSRSTTSAQMQFLATPVISLEDGKIMWKPVDGADGYYVYLKGSNNDMFGGKIYNKTSLELTDIYGGQENTDITISVYAVSDNLDVLCSTAGNYWLENCIANSPLDVLVETLKIATPTNPTLEDGSFVWANGIQSLETYSMSQISNLLLHRSTYREYLNLANHLIEIFSHPVLTYSQYTGFEIPSVEMKFIQYENNLETGEEFCFNVSGEKLLRLSANQVQSLFGIFDLLQTSLEEILAEIEEIADPILKSQLSFFYGNLQAIAQKVVETYANGATEIQGWPNRTEFFEDLVYNQTIIPAGEYKIQIRQLGNSVDLLNSNYSEKFDVFLPAAPQNFDINILEGDFILTWSDVAIPVAYAYAPRDINNDGTREKYILFGKDAGGNTYELLRTNGLNGTLMLNLSQLVEEDILTENITQIFMCVAGDDGKVIQGLSSEKLNIRLLPKLAPYMDLGVLGWNEVVDAAHYSIVATASGFETLSYLQILDTRFTGDNMVANIVYNIELRAIGQIIESGENTTYILSSKPVYLKLSKLEALDVEINKYGIFEWEKVDNMLGYIVDIAGEPSKTYINEQSNSTTFESEYEGYLNYLFTALGTTNQNIDIEDTEHVYYLSSVYNNNGKGLLGNLLPSIENIWVENGVIKFTALENITSTEQAGLNEVIGYRMTINNGIGQIFTTELSGQELYRDTNGNYCFDFTNYGYATSYKIAIQPYIYYTNAQHSLFENATIHNIVDGQEYGLLLGQVKSATFAKTEAPTNVRIVNGEVVWDCQDTEAIFNVEVSTQTSTVYSEWIDSKTWWSTSQSIVPEVDYYIAVKAFKDGFVFSNSAKIIKTDGTSKVVQELKPLDTVFNTYTEPDGSTYISFDHDSGAIELGFNIMYRVGAETDFKYLRYDDERYGEVVTYSMGTAKIEMIKLGDNIEFMEYAIQIVPVGETTYLCSEYTPLQTFFIPDQIDNIYYDENTYEYYWVYDSSVFGVSNFASYVIKDEILGENDELIATYRYKIKTTTLSSEDYYSERMVDGKTAGIVSYMPALSGYKHRVSVAVCIDSEASLSLMSLFKESDQICDFGFLKLKTDIFADDSLLYTDSSITHISNYLLNNAVGSDRNPYLVESASDFEKLNLRLDRLAYTYSYAIEFTYDFGHGEEERTINIIEENAMNYVFKQNVDSLVLSNISIGKITKSQSGTISYHFFNNTYDADSKSINFSFDLASLDASQQTFNLGLFYGLGRDAVVKNLKLAASIDFASKVGANITFGAVAGINNGQISNVYLQNLEIFDIIDSAARGIANLTFGGIVGENAGSISGVITDEISISITLASNATTLIVGGIAGKNNGGNIVEVGSAINFTLVGKTTTYTGGIVGFNTGLISKSFSTGNIVADSTNSNSRTYIGGLAGINEGQGQVRLSYFTGALSSSSYDVLGSGEIYIGGIVGLTRNVLLENNISLMAETANIGDAYRGTVVGYITASVPASFTLTNYYLNNSAVGGATSSLGKFVTNITPEDLVNLINTLNTNAGAIVFMQHNSFAYPIFVWQNNFSLNTSPAVEIIE